MTLTDEQIEEIKSRAEAATPGPWRAEWSERDAMDRIVFNDTGNWLADVVPDDGDGKNKRSDALFIAHARTDIPALLSALEAEKKRADEAEMACEQQKQRGNNHWETLRSIREMARKGDCERIVLWVNDAGSGYTATAESTLVKALDRAAVAETELTQLRARVAELEGALVKYEQSMCEGFCSDVPSGYVNAEMLNDCGGCLARAAIASLGLEVE